MCRHQLCTSIPIPDAIVAVEKKFEQDDTLAKPSMWSSGWAVHMFCSGFITLLCLISLTFKVPPMHVQANLAKIMLPVWLMVFKSTIAFAQMVTKGKYVPIFITEVSIRLNHGYGILTLFKNSVRLHKTLFADFEKNAVRIFKSHYFINKIYIDLLT